MKECRQCGESFEPARKHHVYCTSRCRKKAGKLRERVRRQAKAASEANLHAAEMMVAAMRDMGRVEAIDEPRVVAMLSLAAALDADPLNAQLWREYREADAALRAIGVIEADAFEELRSELMGPS